MDLQRPEFLTYVLIGSVAIAVLAIILYYFPGGKIKLPAIAGTALTCLIAGAAMGVLALYWFGYHFEPGRTSGGQAAGGGRGPGGGGGGGGGGPGRRGGPDGGEGGPARGRGGPRGGATTARQPTAKSQLADLVAKLDVLSSKPPSIKLTDEQKTKIREELKGLEDKEEIREDDAKKTLDALLEILKENKEVLQAAGLHWLGQAEAGSRPAADIPNPFKEKADGDHLKSLRQQLGNEELKSNK